MIEATDEMIDAACAVVPDLYRVDAARAIEAAMRCADSEFSGDQLQQLCEMLGWQGGTFWQALAEVARMRTSTQLALEYLRALSIEQRPGRQMELLSLAIVALSGSDGEITGEKPYENSMKSTACDSCLGMETPTPD